MSEHGIFFNNDWIAHYEQWISCVSVVLSIDINSWINREIHNMAICGENTAVYNFVS